MDNTQLPAANGGDFVRDIDRTGAQTGTPGAKTQVVQLDFGGVATNPEALVTSQQPFPVQDPNTFLIARLAAENVALQRALAQNGFYPLDSVGFLLGVP